MLRYISVRNLSNEPLMVSLFKQIFFRIMTEVLHLNSYAFIKCVMWLISLK